MFVEPRGGWRDETESPRLTPQMAPRGLLGFAVAVSDRTVVAGAPKTMTLTSSNTHGAVYVFVEPQGGWRSATQTAKLTASDGAPGDWLGNSVAIQRNTVIAGAPNATVNGSAGEGAVYAFYKPGRGWANKTESAKVIASSGGGNDVFATGLGMSGNTVAFGAPGAAVHRHAGQGAVYVFSASSSLHTPAMNERRRILRALQRGHGEPPGAHATPLATGGRGAVAGAAIR